MQNETTVASIELAGKVVDKLEPSLLILALFFILAILVVALMLRKAMGDYKESNKRRAAEDEEAIAAHNTGIMMHEGHTTELQALYVRMISMESGLKTAKDEIDTLKSDAIELKARIRHLEDALNDVSLHFKNLELDEETKRTNRVTLIAINRILGTSPD